VFFIVDLFNSSFPFILSVTHLIVPHHQILFIISFTILVYFLLILFITPANYFRY